MVFYFTSNVVSPPVILYMGKDKYENEELIRWGWPEDVWFHVKNYSSAHVYLRLQKNQTIDDIPEEILTDAAQLVKANSIQGNKLNNIQVIYTLWENLKKTPGMCPGEVSFFNDSAVNTIHVEKKINEIVNRLNKTKKERENPDLRAEREHRDAMEKSEEKQRLQNHRLQQKELEKQKQIEKENMSYDRILKKENMTSNKDDGNDSDEFM